MNCRRVNSLLSAYIDNELTGEEMLAIRAHLRHCAVCEGDCEGLRQTKRLLGSLALKTPRAELETLLLCQAQRSSQPAWAVWLEAIRLGGDGMALLAPRPRAVVATAALSLAGLCLAVSPLRDGPSASDVSAARSGGATTASAADAGLPLRTLGMVADLSPSVSVARSAASLEFSSSDGDEVSPSSPPAARWFGASLVSPAALITPVSFPWGSRLETSRSAAAAGSLSPSSFVPDRRTVAAAAAAALYSTR